LCILVVRYSSCFSNVLVLTTCTNDRIIVLFFREFFAFFVELYLDLLVYNATDEWYSHLSDVRLRSGSLVGAATDVGWFYRVTIPQRKLIVESSGWSFSRSEWSCKTFQNYYRQIVIFKARFLLCWIIIARFIPNRY